MLERLQLRNVGPAPEMVLDLASRINLITGDNGLGKSFLLDVAWWALTRKWPRDLNPRLTSGYPARPTNVRDAATLRFTVTTAKGYRVDYKSTYSALDEAWPGRPGRPWIAGLVVYAHAEGGFSVWDPARNYWRRKGDVDVQERVPGYVFSPNEVWTGLNATISGNPVRVCRGVLDDWASWIREQGAHADLMTRVLGSLTVRGEPVEVGSNVRLSVDDAQVSETFGLRQGRSIEAERAIEYSAGWINSSKLKETSTNLPDPFDVEDGWFEIILPSLQLTVAAVEKSPITWLL